MLDMNDFKRQVKDWMRDNPKGSIDALTDFCEEVIPPSDFTRMQWLVEQTVGWYEHVLSLRDDQFSHQEDAQ